MRPDMESSTKDFPALERIIGCECTVKLIKKETPYNGCVVSAMTCEDNPNCVAIYTTIQSVNPFGYHGEWGGWHLDEKTQTLVVEVIDTGTCTVYGVMPPT